MLNDFQNSFTSGLNRLSTDRCRMYEIRRNFAFLTFCISQGIVVTHLSAAVNIIRILMQRYCWV